MKASAFTKTYAGKTVLNMPDFEIPEKTVTAVVGANGSGKTTLARVLAGIEPPDRRTNLLPQGVKVGYMPQKSYAFRMSTSSNISLNGRDKGKAKRLMEALRIDALAKNRAKKLSGGETAKMALARLLMGSYDMLILDEPTASMDVESTLTSEELIRQYTGETGCAVLLITHSIRQAKRLSQRLVYLSKGQLIEQGETAKMLEKPEQELTRSFLDFYGV